MAACSGFPEESYDTVFIILDKMDKIGKEGVAEELEKEGFAKDSIDKYLSLFEEVTEDVNGVRRLKELLEGFLDQKIAEEGTKRGFHVLDAPVTGGDTGAKAGTLSILVGGSREDYEACMPLFKAMGTNINYQGAAGSGQDAKLANQIMIAGTLSGVCEALTYAKAKGLDLQTVLNSVSTGAAGSKQLDTFGPKILAGDYAPGFFMKHFIKDMKLALTEANMSNISLDVLSQVLANYEMLQAEGYGDLGTQALIKYYEEEMEE